MKRIIVWISIVSGLIAIRSRAADSLPAPTPEAAQPPVIDGRLDDAIWNGVTPFTAFKTFKPDFGKDVSEQTRVYMSYDKTHIYFAFHCIDAEPGKIKATMSKRDNVDADDWVGVVLDTFNDQQRGYLFCVNPLGIQMDGMLNADGNGDGSFDTVWQSKGILTGDGYTAEIAVPFKSLRFPFKKNLTMSVFFARWIPRKSEQASYPEIKPDGGSLLSQVHRFEVRDIVYQRPIELLPAVTFGSTGTQEQGRLAMPGGKTDISLTGKLGLTSEMTLDAAYNPDFSQVEADAGQIDVNLRYNLYYPEKRPFFMEGSEMFACAAGMEQSPLGAIVHTRTIADPILGFKLSGKMGARNMGALIFAIDEFPGDQARLHGDEDLAGRNAYFAIYRHKFLLKDDSYIGGFYTGRDFSGSYNRLAGGDGRIRLSKISIFEFSAFHSMSRDHDAVVGRNGDAVNLRYSLSNRHWNLETGYIDIGKDFRTDVGYLTRTGIRTIPLFLMYSAYPKSKLIQKIDAFYWASHSWDRFSSLFETANVLCARFNLPRNSQIRFDAILGNEVFADQRFPINAWRIQANSQLFKQLYANFYVRSGSGIYYDPDDPFGGRLTSVSGGLQYQPTEKLSTSFTISNQVLHRREGNEQVYNYTILRNRTVFQLNKYLFFRGICEYNVFRKKLNLDFLASFTYIPGTVLHIGYGSLYEKTRWNGIEYEGSEDLLQTRRSFFLKASYLFRF